MNRKLLHNEAAKVKMFATFWVKISSFPNAVMPQVLRHLPPVPRSRFCISVMEAGLASLAPEKLLAQNHQIKRRCFGPMR